MLNRKRILFAVAIMACVLCCSLRAQTNSPYSRYGYGVLKDNSVGLSRSMGGISYGLRTNYSANPLNPASYSRVDSLTFLFDIGVNFTQSKLSDGVNNQRDDNGGLEYITILFPLTKGLGFSVGILPFSSVGYSFGSDQTVGGIAYRKTYDGSGGLSQLYAGLGYNTPLKGLSVGANFKYIFGSLKHNRALPQFSSAVSGSNLSYEYNKLSLNTINFDLGVQYEIPLSSDKRLVLGASFTPKKNSKGDFMSRYYDISSSGTTLRADTISADGIDAGIPATIGFGFTLARDYRYTIGADIMYQKWDNVKYSSLMNDGLTESERFNNRWKYSLGGEFMIDPFERNYLKKIRFRGGVNYSNSYLNVKNSEGNIKGYDEYGATIGFGLPIRDFEAYGGRTSYLNINFEYKRIKSEAKYMINEDYYGVSLNINVNELWFVKRKVY